MRLSRFASGGGSADELDSVDDEESGRSGREGAGGTRDEMGVDSAVKCVSVTTGKSQSAVLGAAAPPHVSDEAVDDAEGVKKSTSPAPEYHFLVVPAADEEIRSIGDGTGEAPLRGAVARDESPPPTQVPRPPIPRLVELSHPPTPPIVLLSETVRPELWDPAKR